MNTHPYQQRVVDEKAALDEKIVLLTQFMELASFHALVDAAEADLLNRQHDAMSDYSRVLTERIAAFV